MARRAAHRRAKSLTSKSGAGPSENAQSVPNPTRITLARKRRGYKKTKLAKIADVDLRSITAFESGQFSPAPDTLARIATGLGFPVEFFFGDDIEEPSLYSGSFRSMSKMTAVQRDMALSQAAFGLYFMDLVEDRLELPSTDLPDLSREPNSEAAAESLRRAWALGVQPITSMVHLLEAKGVRVLSLAVDAKEVDAFSMWNGKRPFVFLNTYKSAEHGRFDAAHELGHLVLHKHGPPHGREAETQANQFASAFLMPRGSVLATPPRFATYQTLVKLKKIWTVSVSALNYRLHELRLLSDWHYRSLCVEIAKRGRNVEPEPAPRETSIVLPKVLLALYREGLTRATIARLLTIPADELDQLLFGLTLTSIEGGGRRSQAMPPRPGASNNT